VFPIAAPAIAQRRADVVPLARAFLLGATESMNLGPLTLTASAELALAGRDWPGNVRELRHAVERAAVYAAAEGAGHVYRRHFDALAQGDDADRDLTFQEATRAFQRDLLARTLRDVDGNVSEAARRLDLARSYVYDLITAFGLR